MMNVQRMRHIVDEQVAGLVPPVIVAAVQRWGASEAHYVRSSANHIYYFTQAEQGRFLRLSHADERTLPFLEAELDLLAHLAAAGVPVVQVVPSLGGSQIETVDAGGHRYYAVVFAALEGEQFEAEELDAAQLRAWGSALAALHNAAHTFPHHPARHRWLDDLRAVRQTLSPAETAVARALDRGIAWLASLPAADEGLNHGDFELDNLVWDGSQFWALDFDGAVYAPFGADIAIALQDVWYEADRDSRVAAFLDGYAAVRLLPPDIMTDIPRYLELTAAYKVASLLHCYADTTEPITPAWLANMAQNHDRWLAGKRALLTE